MEGFCHMVSSTVWGKASAARKSEGSAHAVQKRFNVEGLGIRDEQTNRDTLRNNLIEIKTQNSYYFTPDRPYWDWLSAL
jgi:hypothetical protein